MRAAALATAFLLGSVALFVGPSAPVRAIDFGAISNVSGLINVLSPLSLTPGDAGAFLFQLNSTYTQPLVNASLNVSVYEYATIDGSTLVNASWPYPYPILSPGAGRQVNWSWPIVAPGTVHNLSFSVTTSADSHLMPHGSVFNPASYFLRFGFEFYGNASGNLTRFRFESRGFFTQAQWLQATSANATTPCTPPACRGGINVTMLGVDGILPDSSFSVQDPFPRWPFYALLAIALFFIAIAFLFWTEENPEAYPRVTAWWARQRGRLARYRPVRRKSAENR